MEALLLQNVESGVASHSIARPPVSMLAGRKLLLKNIEVYIYVHGSKVLEQEGRLFRATRNF